MLNIRQSWLPHTCSYHSVFVKGFLHNSSSCLLLHCLLFSTMVCVISSARCWMRVRARNSLLVTHELPFLTITPWMALSPPITPLLYSTTIISSCLLYPQPHFSFIAVTFTVFVLLLSGSRVVVSHCSHACVFLFLSCVYVYSTELSLSGMLDECFLRSLFEEEDVLIFMKAN